MANEEILEKLKIVYNALKKPGSWYTGLEIKSFINKHFFDQLEDFSNKVILAGRWSAYSHFNQDLAFQNLLDKHNIDFNSNVLVHPLLPTKFVDLLLQRQVTIHSLDINKSTLNWNKSTLTDYIRQLRAIGKEPDLIIQYTFNGLVEDITESAPELQLLTIPNMVIISQNQLNIQTIKLWESLEYGSVLWNAGDSFIDDELSLVVNSSLANRNWYFSWFLEARTKSILEYHLSQSHDYFLPILEAYFYILLCKYKNIKWWAFFFPWLAKLVNSNEFKSIKEAENVIVENYKNLEYIAIPDVLFEIENNVSKKVSIKSEEVNNTTQVSANLAKQVYHKTLDLLPKLQAGSLEVPDFFLGKSYLNYFFYTTNFDYWNQFCQINNYVVANPLEMHEIFKDKPNLGIANFAMNYYFAIDTANKI